MALSSGDLRDLRDAINTLTDTINNGNGIGGGRTGGVGGAGMGAAGMGGAGVPRGRRSNDYWDRLENEVDNNNWKGTRWYKETRKQIQEGRERNARGNAGMSQKDIENYEKSFNRAKFGDASSIIGSIKQIGDIIISIVFALKENALAGQRNYFEYSQKLLEADVQYRSKQFAAMTTTFTAFTSSIASDAAFAGEKTISGEVLGQFTKSVSGQKAGGEYQAAQARRDAKFAQSVGQSIGSALMAAGTGVAVIPAIGWVAGAITAGIGALISLGSTLYGNSKEFSAEQTEQITKQFDAQTSVMSKAFEDTCRLIDSIDDYAKKIVDYSMKNDESYKQMGMVTGFTGDRYAAYGRQMSEALSKTFNITAQQAKQMFDAYTAEVGRVKLLNVRDYGNIRAVGRGFDISEGESGKILGHMNLFNQSIQSGADMLVKEWKQITKMGLSSTKFAKDLDKNLKLAEKHNFKGGIEGMMKLTRWAQQTRFNLDSAVSFAEKIQEGGLAEGIEASAKLQVLGGAAATYSDPLGMLFDTWNDVGDLAKRQASMFGDITGAFSKKTGQTEFTGYENMMIAARAKAMGMSVEDAKNMIRERDKQKQVGSVLKGYGLDEDTRTAIGNRAQWNKDKGTWEVETRNGTMSLADVVSLTKAQREEILMPENEEEAIYDIAEDTRSIREKMEANFNAAMGRKEKEMHQDVVTFTQRTTKSQTDLLEGASFTAQARESLDAIATNMEVRTRALETFMNQGTDLIRDVRTVLNQQVMQQAQITTFMRGSVEFMKDTERYSKMLYEANRKMIVDGQSAGSVVRSKALGSGDRIVVGAAFNQKDGIGSTNGGVMVGVSNVKPINDGGVNVGFAKKDQYLAAMPNGPIDKILQQLIPGLQALLKGNGSSSNSLNVNVNGKIDVEQDGSIVNIVDLIKKNPSVSSQIVSIIKKTMDVNAAGKPRTNYM